MPGTWTLGILVHELVGFNAWVFRATSLILHLGNSYLLFRLFQRLNPSQPLAVGLAAIFFALHPTQIECVVWISSMKGLLSTAFALISLQCFLSHKPKRTWGSLAFGAALLCKQDVVALPFILAVLSLLVGQKQKLVSYISLGLMSCVAAAMTMLGNRGNVSPATPEGALALIARPFCALGNYLSHWLFPVGLYPEYRFEAHAHWLNGILGATGILLVAGLVILCLKRRENTYLLLLAGSSATLLALAPVLGLLPSPLEFASDRLSYFASVFMAMVVGVIAAQLLRNEKMQLGGMFLLALVFAGLSWHQLKAWQNDETLCRYIIAQDQFHYLAGANLALIHARAGDFHQAEPLLRNVVAAHPKRARASVELVKVLRVQGKKQEADRILEQALQWHPHDASLLGLRLVEGP